MSYAIRPPEPFVYSKEYNPMHYFIKAGDTLSRIAAANRTTVAELQRLNSIANPDKIFIGQRILLPTVGGGSGLPTVKPLEVLIQGGTLVQPQLTATTPGVSVAPVGGFWGGLTSLFGAAAGVAPAIHGAILQNQANKQATKDLNNLNLDLLRNGQAPVQLPATGGAPAPESPAAKSEWMSYLPWVLGGGAVFWAMTRDDAPAKKS